MFDITNQEKIVGAPVGRTIFHTYSDDLPPDLTVQCYSLDELLAEKTRALYERTRPRDLYDLVYLLENCIDAVNLADTREVFAAKCDYKGLQVPSSEHLVRTLRDNNELTP